MEIDDLVARVRDAFYVATAAAGRSVFEGGLSLACYTQEFEEALSALVEAMKERGK